MFPIQEVDVKTSNYIFAMFCFLFAFSSCSSWQAAAPRDVEYSPVIPELRGFGYQDAEAGIRTTERTVYQEGSRIGHTGL